jgi:AcrR family transcriptional regulator
MLRNDPAQPEEAPPRPGLRQQRKEQKLERIVRAGRSLFVEKGFERTTTRAIASKAGVGAGTFFLYFKEKRDLLCRIFAQDIRGTTAGVYQSLDPTASLVDQLDHLFGSLLEYYAREPRLSLVFVKEVFFLEQKDHQGAAEMFADFAGRLAGLVASAQARGEVARSVDPGAAAVHAFALYGYAAVAWLTGVVPTRELARGHLRAQLELLMRGIASRGEKS